MLYSYVEKTWNKGKVILNYSRSKQIYRTKIQIQLFYLLVQPRDKVLGSSEIFISVPTRNFTETLYTIKGVF